MPDPKETERPQTTPSDSGHVTATPDDSSRETSQAEGGDPAGEKDRKVGRTPGQAEGTDDPDHQDEK